ncbi:MAG: hypothetical protein RLZZ227_1395, partial [Pseudomonadota bacterium]
TYSGGVCARGLGIQSVPTSLFGITLPQNVIDTVEALIVAVWLNHENARVTHKYGSNTVENVERGFFADSQSAAVNATLIYLADAVIPDQIAYSDSYVGGHVAADTGRVCNMTDKTSGVYSSMRSGILGSNSTNYSLLFHNCQHWAAARQM